MVIVLQYIKIVSHYIVHLKQCCMSIIPHFNLSKIFEMKIEKDFLVFMEIQKIQNIQNSFERRKTKFHKQKLES